MLLSPASNNGSLPAAGFWGRFKAKPKEPQTPDNRALARQRLLTLAYGDMETVRMLPMSYAELDAVARDWTKPPPDAQFTLRVPVEYASLHAARLVSGPYIYLTGEDSYQIATMGVQGLRVEIASDAPPPPDEPPPPPVLEMPATFNLELTPGQHVALETVVSDEYDMARMEDGTTVDGMFWGKLDIVHQDDTHKMEFSGTRLTDDYPPDFLLDSRVLAKLAMATRPAAAKCQLSILSPEVKECDLTLQLSPMWTMNNSWPPAERLGDNKVKFFVRVNPGGALEHFESEVVTTAIYYEAIPEPSMVDPNEYITPRNGFAMSFRDFIPHLSNVMDQLGMSLHAKTNFMNNNMSTFSQYQNIAYRFLGARKIAAAVDITVRTDTADICVFTRIFLMFRGLSDEDASLFDGAGEKEANAANWREVVGWSENSKDPSMFRILETSILDVT